jgi:hypothetical protein
MRATCSTHLTFLYLISLIVAYLVNSANLEVHHCAVFSVLHFLSLRFKYSSPLTVLSLSLFLPLRTEGDFHARKYEAKLL